MRTTLVVGLLVMVIVVVGAVVVVDQSEDTPLNTEGPARVTVDQIVDVQPRWYRESVTVDGTAFPIDGERFVLRGEERAVVVEPDPEGAVEPLERGERVTVTGVVYGFSRVQTGELEELVGNGRHPELADAPTDLGDVYIDADRVADA